MAVKFGLMTRSGTSAIHLALKSIKINKNDEINLTRFTSQQL